MRHNSFLIQILHFMQSTSRQGACGLEDLLFVGEDDGLMNLPRIDVGLFVSGPEI